MEYQQPSPYTAANHSNFRMISLVIALFCLGALAVGLWVRDREHTEAFDIERVKMKSDLSQAVSQNRMQVEELNHRLDVLTAAQQARSERPAPAHTQMSQAAKARPAGARTVAQSRRRPSQPVVANDPRFDGLQGQLSDTQKELARTRDELSGRINSTRDDLNGSIAQTRDDVAKARDELAKSHDELSGKIGATRDELNGSIARTHEEVVALRKRGETNIYEFRLDKSKFFQPVGPLSLALHSTNAKHKTYDLGLIVEDNKLDKKHVNLYEPIWIRLSDRPQAIELVVNHIDNNRIAGYLSEPKYKKSELASNAEKAPEKPQQLATR
jgi:hypothetical protein